MYIAHSCFLLPRVEDRSSAYVVLGDDHAIFDSAFDCGETLENTTRLFSAPPLNKYFFTKLESNSLQFLTFTERDLTWYCIATDRHAILQHTSSSHINY